MKEIPNVNQLNTNVSNDLKSKLSLSTDFLKKTLNAFSLVLSAQLYLMYLFLRDIQDNIFVDKAVSESQGGTLERLGRQYLNRNPFPATTGVFKVSVTGVAGSVLRENLTFKSNEDALNQGQVYVLDSAYTLTGTSDIIEIRSIGIGIEYNLNVADNLTITEPIIGVDKTVTVIEVFTQPKSAESTETYRQAILNAIQLEPQGGSRSDYRQWASDAQGVRLIFPYVRDSDAGKVDVYVEAILADSVDQVGIGKNGVPTSEIITKVEEVIEQDPDITKPINERGRRPMQSILTVLPIVLVPIDVSIVGLQNDTVAVRATIRTNLEQYIYDVRPFISGADLRRNKNDILYSGRVQSVVTDSLSNGNFFNSLSLLASGIEVVSTTFDLGRIPYLRNVTYS